MPRAPAKRRHAEGKQQGGIYNRNGHYTVKVKVRGRQVWKSAPTLELAQKILGDLREDAALERVGIPKVQRATVREWAENHYLPAARLKKRSVNRDASIIALHLVPYLGHRRLIEVTHAVVEGYQQARLTAPDKSGRKVKGPTVNREVAILRRILSHAVTAGELEKNPLARVPMLPESPARQPTLELEDEAALVAACPPWLAFLVRVALATGARQGELLALTWRHVDFQAGELVIADSKSGESRRVCVHPAILTELRERRGTPAGWVFTMQSGRVPPNYIVGDHFRRAVRKAGLPGFRFHDLRHVAASRLLATGASLPEVATFLGHKTLIIARRYAHVSTRRLASLIAAMPAPATAAQAPALAAGGGDRGPVEVLP